MFNINKIFFLPDDIIREIFDYIPREKLVFVNSTYYNLYHHLLRNRINTYESYIRDMIRRDNDYVFERIVRENFENWLKNKNYRYKDMIFSNYIYFIIQFCIENNSEKCRELFMKELTKRDLVRNLHKKNVIKYIKWKN